MTMMQIVTNRHKTKGPGCKADAVGGSFKIQHFLGHRFENGDGGSSDNLILFFEVIQVEIYGFHPVDVLVLFKAW